MGVPRAAATAGFLSPGLGCPGALSWVSQDLGCPMVGDIPESGVSQSPERGVPELGVKRDLGHSRVWGVPGLGHHRIWGVPELRVPQDLGCLGLGMSRVLGCSRFWDAPSRCRPRGRPPRCLHRLHEIPSLLRPDPHQLQTGRLRHIPAGVPGPGGHFWGRGGTFGAP